MTEDLKAWDAAEVGKLALGTGKPAEVSTALTFIAKGWKAHLSSYYEDEDGVGVVRELDVLATYEVPLRRDLQGKGTRRMRALVSCRGFPDGEMPLLYTVSEKNVPSFPPRLICSKRVGQVTNGNEDQKPLERAAADRVLQRLGLKESRPVVAFDVVTREHIPAEKRKGGVEIPARVDYALKTDPKEGNRKLWSAVSSSIKAAAWWAYSEDPASTIDDHWTLNVPITVLAKPFWNVCLDDGKLGPTELGHLAFQTSLTPGRPRTRTPLALICSADKLHVVADALLDVFGWFESSHTVN